MARSGEGAGDVYGGLVGRAIGISRKFGGKKTVIAWEGGELERQKWFPNYKGQRRARQTSWEGLQAFQEALEDIQRHLPLLGIWQAVAKGWEGDDVMATISRTWPGTTLLVSEDGDLDQLVSDTCHVYRPHRHRLDVDPDPLALHRKALEGCNSDEVPGVEGFGPKRSSEVLAAYPDAVRDVLSGRELPVLDGRAGKLLDRLRSERAKSQLCLSALLVTLYTVDITVIPPSPDRRAARAWAARHGLGRCLED